MDPKGLFLCFLNPYCMCGPTFEVNIQCVLPLLPAASSFLNFVLSQMRPDSNWPHQNCFFFFLSPWINRILLWGPRLNLRLLPIFTHKSQIEEWKGYITENEKEKSENFFFLFTKLSQIHLLKGKLNCPKGKFKLRPKSGHPSVQGIASWACFNCND